MKNNAVKKEIVSKSNKVYLKAQASMPSIFSVDKGGFNRLVQNVNIYWSWGDNNLLPVAIAALNRKSNVNRAILNNKALYTAGNGYNTTNIELENYLLQVNNQKENFKKLLRKLAFDYLSQGNGFLEVVTNSKRNFLNLFHHDCTTNRLGKTDKYEGYDLLHPDWTRFSGNEQYLKQVALYPNWERDTEGNIRTMIHFKDYEQMFNNYGVMGWVAGLNVSAIAYKTDKWNVSRLDNSFSPSTVVRIGGEFDSDKDAADLAEYMEKNFSGDGMAGRTIFLVKNGDIEKQSEVITLNDSKDSDWKELHLQSTNDLIIAHNWFRSLSGIADNTGFDTKRILNEYEVAINTVINDLQEFLLSPIKEVIQQVRGWDCSDLEVINKPPVSVASLIDINSVITKDEGREYLGLEPLNDSTYIKTAATKEVKDGIQ